MSVYREFPVFINAAELGDMPNIGDRFEVVALEDGQDQYRGTYILVKLAPVEKEYKMLDEIHGEYNYE